MSAIQANTASRRRFAEDDVTADFSDEGIFRVPLRTWIIERLHERRRKKRWSMRPWSPVSLSRQSLIQIGFT